MNPKIPCVVFEDEHLLAVSKPAGLATHRAGDDAPWGMVEWIQNCRSDLLRLGIHQRLDRPTSGLLLFAKSPEANHSLSRQFEGRTVRKTYLFVTRGISASRLFTAQESLEEKTAVTHFQWRQDFGNGYYLWEARPETGRTHQVRLHAAGHGLPIVGDGGPSTQALEPLLLHSFRLELKHPTDGRSFVLEAPMPSYFEWPGVDERRAAAARCLRKALIDPSETNVCRLIHRESDGFPKWTMDRLGEWAYIEDFGGRATPEQIKVLVGLLEFAGEGMFRGVILSRALQGMRREEKFLLRGEAPPSNFHIMENGVRYSLVPMEAGGTGLFLDQRENRRRIRTLARGRRVLNLFSYTCGFSVAAAVGGSAETVNVDLSRRILEVGRRNFELNGLNASIHRFYAEDAFDMLRRLCAKKETFGIVVIDPPSFSRSKKGNAFSVKQDFGRLIAASIPLLEPGGWLLASSNHAGWKSSDFLAVITRALREAGRCVEETIWMPQGFDFPITPACPAHLKSAWIRLSAAS